MVSDGHPMPQRLGESSDRHSAFVLGNPPLAALHNMTERKLPPPPTSSTSPNSPTPYMCPYSSQKAAQFAYGIPSTPHGINDILGRPLGAFGQLGVSPALYLNTSAACYAAAAAAAATPLAELPGRPPVYWPGMLQPPAWRTSQGKTMGHLYFSWPKSFHTSSDSLGALT